tara:strand:- start:16439 stop:17047 length:609 start_codon:yes stop_codon:yes gene_type:complete
MVQTARPNEEEFNTGGTDAWAATSGSDLHAMINEASADDSDYISTSDSGNNANYKMHLSSVTDPVSSSGHILRYRLKWADVAGMGVDQPTVNVKLMQDQPDGSSPGTCSHIIWEIQHTSSSNTLSTSFSTETVTLSTSQANTIQGWDASNTGYSSLCLHIGRNTSMGAGETVYLSWVEFEVPDVSAGALPMAMNTYKQLRNN